MIYRLTDPELRAIAAEQSLTDLMAEAARLRDQRHGVVISYSRKVFIPLTRLCRDVCHYCTFAETPRAGRAPFMTIDEVLAVARAGRDAGCREALFTLGDKPELSWRAAREWLEAHGFASTIDYLAHAADAVFRGTGLFPHVNPGVMTAPDIARLRGVAISQGLMLETSAQRLSDRGGPHFGSPDKHPAARLETIALAGAARVPFTTGILIGIGETREERLDALLALRDLDERHGHIQEIIVQNFRAKPGTRMALAPDAELDDLKWTIAVARLAFGPHMSIQAPPNLSYARYPELIAAGLNDWGGISPVTPDHVNPEAAWPHIEALAAATAAHGKTLVERLASYPDFVMPQRVATWHDVRFVPDLLRSTDATGFARVEGWAPGSTASPPIELRPRANDRTDRSDRGDPGPIPNSTGQGPGSPRSRAPAGDASVAVSAIIERAAAGRRLDEASIARLFEARGADLDAVLAAADDLRRMTCGDTVTYVVNRNINYTNVCGYRCRFCAFSKGTAKALRGAPYDLGLEEIVRRAREAWARGATEVCLQGGIHPDYTGATYLAICRAIKAALPEMHIHAFSPLEVAQGAATLGISARDFLAELKAAGLGSLPGTAAEILDDEVRRELCPDKLTTQQWLEVVATAHAVGLDTTATIMFGHIDTPVHWARHLLAIRDLQEASVSSVLGRFTELVPLPFVHMEAPMALKGAARRGPTFREALLMHAVARLVLNPLIANVQASWVKLGPAGVGATLAAGVNDLGGTLMNESISRAAGTAHGEEMTPEAMETLIRAAGRSPRQRTTLYGTPPPDRVTASFGALPCAPRLEPAPRRGLPSRMAGAVLARSATEAAE